MCGDDMVVPEMLMPIGSRAQFTGSKRSVLVYILSIVRLMFGEGAEVGLETHMAQVDSARPDDSNLHMAIISAIR